MDACSTRSPAPSAGDRQPVRLQPSVGVGAGAGSTETRRWLVAAPVPIDLRRESRPGAATDVACGSWLACGARRHLACCASLPGAWYAGEDSDRSWSMDHARRSGSTCSPTPRTRCPGRAGGFPGPTSGYHAIETMPTTHSRRHGDEPPRSEWRSPAGAGAAERARRSLASPCSTACRQSRQSPSFESATTLGPSRRRGNGATSCVSTGAEVTVGWHRARGVADRWRPQPGR